MANVLLYFSTNAETMVATKTLKDVGVIPRLVVKPASVTAASNLCLSIETETQDKALAALRTANLSPGLAA